MLLDYEVKKFAHLEDAFERNFQSLASAFEEWKKVAAASKLDAPAEVMARMALIGKAQSLEQATHRLCSFVGDCSIYLPARSRGA